MVPFPVLLIHYNWNPFSSGMAGVIATALMQMQVKSQQQQYAEKLPKNSLCLSIDLETQPLVSNFLIHDHKTLQVPKIL